jgi:hypothetical protein
MVVVRLRGMLVRAQLVVLSRVTRRADIFSDAPQSVSVPGQFTLVPSLGHAFAAILAPGFMPYSVAGVKSAPTQTGEV